MGPSRLTRTGLAVGTIAAMMACADGAANRFISPDASLGQIPGGGTAPLTTSAPVLEIFKVCKQYVGEVGPAVTVTVDVPVIADFNVTLNDGECRSVWVQGGATDPNELVTVTETAVPGYTTTWTKATLTAGGIANDAGAGLVASGSVGANPLTGVVVTFINTQDVVEEPGCTLTQGYWKTHSSHGPAPEDDGWDAVGGPDVQFFSSGKTWFELFWTPPKGGNKYIQLAHQYMAAKLNILNGASTTPAVDAAITAAETYFNSGATPQNPGTVPAGLASTLADYNEGTIGPGHCDDTSAS